MTLAADTAARMRARFAGRLQAATLTRHAAPTIDPDDPTAAPDDDDDEDFEVEGYAFAYEQRDIDGTRIPIGDYRVTLLRTDEVLPQPGDIVSIPPPGEATARDGRVIAVEAVTEAFTTLQVRG